MTSFLKLSNRVLNVAFIKHVDIDKTAEKYIIHLATNSHGGVSILGSGLYKSEPDIVWACKKEHPESYQAIEEWLNRL